MATKETIKKTAIHHSGGTERIAVILVRGFVKMDKVVLDTLTMLRLNRKNHCVVINGTKPNVGMLIKVKDYITWGPISEKTYEKLVLEKGEEFQSRTEDSRGKYHYKFIEFKNKKYKPYFRLNPPRKGFGRKGVKISFQAGGALGNRGEKINDLIERML